MYKAIVFDLDGTLLDTLDDLWVAVNAALQTQGLPLRTKEEVRGFVGNGAANLMQLACGIENYAEQAALLEAFHAYYRAHIADYTKPYDGILPLLKQLKEAGIKTAVLSNKPDVAVKTLAKEYFQDLLTEAAGENEAAGIRKKPAPDALFALIERLDVTKAETLYVGDSEVDILTAKNAGVDCVSVSWGFKTREFLKANGAQCIVDEPNALASHCGL